LISFNLVIWPSVWPFDLAFVIAAATAARFFITPSAKDARSPAYFFSANEALTPNSSMMALIRSTAGPSATARALGFSAVE
jgi:hypothetical protein